MPRYSRLKVFRELVQHQKNLKKLQSAQKQRNKIVVTKHDPYELRLEQIQDARLKRRMKQIPTNSECSNCHRIIADPKGWVLIPFRKPICSSCYKVAPPTDIKDLNPVIQPIYGKDPYREYNVVQRFDSITTTFRPACIISFDRWVICWRKAKDLMTKYPKAMAWQLDGPQLQVARLQRKISKRTFAELWGRVPSTLMVTERKVRTLSDRQCAEILRILLFTTRYNSPSYIDLIG